MATHPRGNEGFHILDELACQAIPDAPVPGLAEARFLARRRMVEIVIDHDFASYTEIEQERLLSAIKRLLVVAGDVRVVRRASR